MRTLSSTLVASLVLALGITAAAAPAGAQTRRPAARRLAPAEPRVFLGVSGGYQSTTTEFDDQTTFELYRETARTDVTYPIDAGFLFDAGGGVRLWRGLGVGVAVSHFSRDGAAHTSSSLPHPFFLNQPRQVEGDADGIQRKETGVHVQAQYTVPVTRSVFLTLAGGPSVLQVNQMLVSNVRYSEEYPYDTATFTGVDTRDVSASATGFNAGVDLRWMFSRSVGVGGFVRITKATVDLEGGNDRTISVDAGGTHAGVGLRFAF